MVRETNDRKQATKRPPRAPRSMHEDVPTWCDCCSCEAEPRWQAVEDEMDEECRREAQAKDASGHEGSRRG